MCLQHWSVVVVAVAEAVEAVVAAAETAVVYDMGLVLVREDGEKVLTLEILEVMG